MSVTLDRQQGANAWLTVGLREGKNREIRRAMEDIGFSVSRLLRLSYGPFQLGALKPGEVEELRPRVIRDQLGLEAESEDTSGKAARAKPTRGARPARKPSGKTPPPYRGEEPARGKPGPKAGARGSKPAQREKPATGKKPRPGAKGPSRPGKGPIGKNPRR